MQRIRQLSLGIGSIVLIIAAFLLITHVDSLSFEVFTILAITMAVIIISSITYQAYINLRQFYIRKKDGVDSTCEFIQEEQVSDEDIIEEIIDNDEHDKLDLKNRIAFFMINGIAELFEKSAEWNKETNEIVVRDIKHDEGGSEFKKQV